MYRSDFGFIYITSYPLAVEAMRDDRFTVDPQASATASHKHPDSSAFSILNRTIKTIDGARHRRLRSLVSTIFTPRAAEQLRPAVERSIAAQLDSLDLNGEIDFVSGVARLLPTQVVLDVLGLGEHLDTFVEFARLWIAMQEPTADEETIRRADAVFAESERLVLGRAEDRVRQPRADLLTALVQAGSDSDSDGRLSQDELVAMVLILIAGGYETTANTLATGLYHMVRNPGQLSRLRQTPNMIKSAVEELLRYDSAARNAVGRYALTDAELAGCTVRKGEKVYVSVHAANHDAAVFDNPHTLDLAREPNRHIAFGGGAHYCLGGAVARMELEVVWGTLLDRYSGIEIPSSEIRWKNSFIVRGLESLPLRLVE